jgi:predicted TIM-barrel fold metal-dependent hydrolase
MATVAPGNQGRGQAGWVPPRWLDTHVHVSHVTPEGKPRPDTLEPLLAVQQREPTDLRFVISCDVPQIFWMADDPEAVVAGNAMVNDLVRRAPGRLYGACTVNPRFLDASLRSMEQCFGQWGFIMLGEFLPYVMNHRMCEPGSERLVREAVALDVPVQVHISTSNTKPQGQFVDGGTEQLEDLLDLVERVPEARYVLAHFIGSPKANPPVEGYIDQIERRFGRWPDNFWAEIRDTDSPGVPVALRRIPRQRLLIGTDWVTRVGPPFMPYGIIFGVTDPAANPYPPGVESMAGFLAQAGVSAADIADIAAGNAASLLRIG